MILTVCSRHLGNLGYNPTGGSEGGALPKDRDVWGKVEGGSERASLAAIKAKLPSHDEGIKNKTTL